MTYSSEINEKIANCFYETKRRFKPLGSIDGAKYICEAINTTMSPQYIKTICATIIKDRMSGVYVLETWLKEVQGISDEFISRKNMHAYRIAWLEALIKEFKTKK